MKIAVTANGTDVSSTVPPTFAEARWLLIIDMDELAICEAIEKSDEDSENEKFAEAIADRDCESVICGEIEKKPFDILVMRQITRCLGSNLTVTDALNCESMLPFITDYINGYGGGSPHVRSDGSCCGSAYEQSEEKQ